MKQHEFDRMNTTFLLLILLNCLILEGFLKKSVAISEVKFNHRSLETDKTYATRLHSKARSYLYLNYKEAYGIRFVPKKIDRKAQSNDNDSTWNIMPTERVDITTTSINLDDMPTMSNVPKNSTDDVTTISIPTSSEVSVTTPNATVDDKVSSTESTRPYKQQILSFTTLRNKVIASKKPNATVIQQAEKHSALKETLKLIRKRIKQWISFGTDSKASILNEQRFLNVFNVIKFENNPCTSTQEGLTEMSGICYHDYQCSQLGGSSIDECADGLGVCCVFKTGCGQTTNQLDSYFLNPGWPEASQDRLICTLTLELQEGVSQVRLDFILFELKPPTDGNCVDDQFFVAGQNLNNPIPTICGVNSGQHMYIEVDNSMNRKLFLSILTTSVATRAFNIRAMQLKDSLAPSNCLQYFTDTEGWFQTFNYDDTSQFVTNRIPSYFNNLNYVICIKRQWNYCSTTYSNEADGVEYDFQLINIDSEGMSVIPEKQAGIEIFSCNDDYISVNSIRLCGEKLNDASRIDDLTQNALIADTTNGLNIIPVRTNNAAVGRGFRINYMQLPCEDQITTMEPATDTTEDAVSEDVPTSKYKRHRRT